MLPEVALIVAVPALRVVATPPEVIVATLEFDEVHVTEVVRFWVLPSVYIPVATYWTFAPTFTDWFDGVTTIDTKTAGPTVNVVLPVTPSELALIWTVPCAVPVANPPAVMVATSVFDETHVAELVTSNLDPSE